MDNYRDHKLDADDTIFCQECGKRLEDLGIMAEGTELEREVELCTWCIDKLAGIQPTVIL